MSDLYGGNVVKPVYGRVVLKKLFGSGSVAVGTQIVIPHAAVMPRNPLNVQFLTGVNSAGYESGDVTGKRTPSVIMATVIKTSSYFTAAFLSSTILATNANGDTDTWGILIDDTYAPLVYDGAKCSMLRLRQFSRGGPALLTLGFHSMYGDSENPGTVFAATTFTATSEDPGSVTDVTQINYGASPTANLVNAFDMTLRRPQAHIQYDDGTVFPAGVSSGVLTGDVVLTQATKYSETWATGGTVRIGQTGAGVNLALLVKSKQDVSDLVVKDRDTAGRMKVRHYRLYDSVNGGAPVVASAL